MKQTISFLFVVLQLILLGLVSADPKKDKLISLVQSNNLVKLNSNTYDRFTEGKRDYGMVVLLTALGSQFNCMPCRQFDPEYELVAKSFSGTKEKDNLFFGHLDFQDGQAIYQKLKLMSAPNVFYFPPQKAGETVEFVKYDLTRSGFQAENFAEFLSQQTGFKVPVKRPIDYTQVTKKVILAVVAAAVLKFAYRNFAFIFYHKNTWTVISIGIILVMTSGYMWNRIRQPAFFLPGKNGEINYIAAGFSSQLGAESQIIASVYGVLAFSLIALITSVPKLEDPLRQRIGIYIWLACLIFIFSALLGIFKIKNGGYPFKLLL
ncbi:hypothetical protein BD560DRAFT_382710 [Blakeslea trispora]|nr:hypothetical protein BD560DRAFT_382710 [Blakeslea trispora]